MTTKLSTQEVAHHAIAELNHTRWELEKMKVKMATVQAENRRLRRLTQNGAAGRRLHRTAADARQIIGWRFAGYTVTRTACYGYGMSERRWAWAVALLKLAKVLDYNVVSADEFDTDDMDTALAQVDTDGRNLRTGRGRPPYPAPAQRPGQTPTAQAREVTEGVAARVPQGVTEGWRTPPKTSPTTGESGGGAVVRQGDAPQRPANTSLTQSLIVYVPYRRRWVLTPLRFGIHT